MIVNGREKFVGSDKTRLLGALNAEAAQPRVGLELTRAVLVEGALDTTIELHGAVSKPLDLFAVITDDSDRSNVLRGENAGSLLQHVAVARTLERVGRVSVAGEQHATIHVPADLRPSLHAGHHLGSLCRNHGWARFLGRLFYRSEPRYALPLEQAETKRRART